MFVELLLRVGSPRPPVGVFGPGFTLCIVNAGNSLRVFLESTVSPETLSKFYGVKRVGYEELLKMFGSEAWAWFRLENVEYNRGMELDHVLEELIALLIAMDMGTGRAAGLGHVFSEPSPLGFRAGGGEGEADTASG